MKITLPENQQLLGHHPNKTQSWVSSHGLILLLVALISLDIAILGLIRMAGINQQLWDKVAIERNLSQGLQSQVEELKSELALNNQEVQKRLEQYRNYQNEIESIYKDTDLMTRLSKATVRIQGIYTGSFSWLDRNAVVALSLCHGGIIKHNNKYFVITAAHCIRLPAESGLPSSLLSEIRISISRQIEGNSYRFDDDASFTVPIADFRVFDEIDFAAWPINFRQIRSTSDQYIEKIALTIANSPIQKLDPVIITRRFEDDGQNIITPTILLIDGIAPAPFDYYYQLLGNAVPGESGSIALNKNGEIIGILSARSNNILNVMLVGFNSIKQRLNRL